MALNWAGDELICEHRDIKATAAAIDCTGRFLVLAGRLGTSVIDLNNPQSVLRKLNRKSRWEVSTVGWNHHPEYRHVVAIGSNQKVDILNFEYSTGELIDNGQSIKGLERSVLDLDWNSAEPGLLVTCSVDNYVNIWDMRDLRKPMANLPSVCGASQSKWSKTGKTLLATAHEADCKIWDFRKATTPIEYIAAHSSKINGLDWSPTSANSLVTCAQDFSVKVWDISSPKKPENHIQVAAPVWRARFTPFGEALVTVGIPQIHRGDTSLSLWALNDTSSPVHVFSGHTEGIYDFFWRSPRNAEYQLVSWSKDQSLRLWKTDSSVQKQCGAAYLNHGVVLDYPHYDGYLHGSREHFSTSSLSLLSERDGVCTVSPPGSPVSQLDRELKSVDIGNVAVDEIDVKLRTCVVNITAGPHLVKINLSFPLGYPEISTPNFNIGKETTLNASAIHGISQGLNDTFRRCLKNQSMSVIPAIRSAVQFLGTLSADASPSPRQEPHPVFISPPAQQPPVVSSTSAVYKLGVAESRFNPQRTAVESPLISAVTARLYGANTVSFPTDTLIPFPRICGLCFAGDKLLMWSDHWKLGNNGRDKVSGSFKEIFPSDLASRQRQVRKALKKKGKPERPTITVYNVANLSPFQAVLAANYMNDSQNPVESFRFNAELADRVGRHDLAHVWKLLSVVMQTPSSVPGGDALDDATWSMHPCGRAMLEYLINRYRDCYDSSFLATLLCILCRFPCSQKRAVPPPLAVPPPVRNHKSSSHLIAPPHHESDAVDGCYQMVSHAVRDRRANSLSTATASLELGRKLSVDSIRVPVDRFILNPARKEEFDLFKREYCELLYGARLLNKRAEIMKCLGNPAEPHRGVEYFSTCHKCNCDTRGGRCSTCKYVATCCTICHIPVRGLSTFCTVCCHGGHLLHMQHWFENNIACPSGCGCLCLEATKTATV